jgi:hypothetical protein
MGRNDKHEYLHSNGDTICVEKRIQRRASALLEAEEMFHSMESAFDANH